MLKLGNTVLLVQTLLVILNKYRKISVFIYHDKQARTFCLKF